MQGDVTLFYVGWCMGLLTGWLRGGYGVVVMGFCGVNGKAQAVGFSLSDGGF